MNCLNAVIRLFLAGGSVVSGPRLRFRVGPPSHLQVPFVQSGPQHRDAPMDLIYASGDTSSTSGTACPRWSSTHGNPPGPDVRRLGHTISTRSRLPKVTLDTGEPTWTWFTQAVTSYLLQVPCVQGHTQNRDRPMDLFRLIWGARILVKSRTPKVPVSSSGPAWRGLKKSQLET